VTLASPPFEKILRVYVRLSLETRFVKFVQGNELESFIYLGSLIHCSDGSELEIKRRATIVRESMFALEQNIWRSSVTLETRSGYTMFAFFRYFCTVPRYGL